MEKVGDRWEDVIAETSGAWKDHPIFGRMKDSLEIVRWLRGEVRIAIDTM
ncbi:MAG: hypothetical protein ACE5Z5_03030 [Candidatus Bathyarchaeia archaeon]